MTAVLVIVAGADDNRCVVKLLNNYRSHEDILKISSELFYEGVCRQLSAPSHKHQHHVAEYLLRSCPSMMAASLEGSFLNHTWALHERRGTAGLCKPYRDEKPLRLGSTGPAHR